LTGSPQQKKEQTQTEEYPDHKPTAAEKLQYDTKNSYADGKAEPDEVGSAPKPESFTKITRKRLR